MGSVWQSYKVERCRKSWKAEIVHHPEEHGISTSVRQCDGYRRCAADDT
jgi:hypothetical protein